MKEILYACVVEAIGEVGLAQFKKTSLFLSNEKAIMDEKEAA